MHRYSNRLTAPSGIRSVGSRVARAASILVFCGFSAVAGLAAQGVRYHLTPSAMHIEWNDRLGLENSTLLGGRIGATFGQLLGLEGYYYIRDGVNSDLGRTGLTTLTGGPLTNQAVKLQHFGGDLRIQLGSGAMNPFVYGGAGVLRFEPDSGPRTDQIVLKYGGGIRFALTPGVEAQVFVENARFRLDRFRLAGDAAVTLPDDPEAKKTRDNLSFGFGLGIGIGASKSGNEREKWSLASIPIEPFIGRLEFDESSLEHQWFLGVRSGVDVGQYVGLRAFYMHGVDYRFDKTTPIKSYGGEAQFNLNANRGPAPYLIAGAGRLDFGSDFRDANGAPRDDRTTLIVGGGIGIRLTDQFRLNAAARDFIYTNDDFANVSATNDLRHNLLLSAGVSFSIGRSRAVVGEDRDRGGEPVRERLPARCRERDRGDAGKDDLDRDTDVRCSRAARSDRDRCGDRSMSSDQDRADRADRAEANEGRRMERLRCERRRHDERARCEARIRGEPDDRDRTEDRPADRNAAIERCLKRSKPAGRDGADPRTDRDNFVSDKNATFPVPVEGEIYIRYGKPGASRVPAPDRADSLAVRREASDTTRERRPDAAAARPLAAPLDSAALEARTLVLVDSLVARRQRDDSARTAAIVRDALREAERDRRPATPVEREPVDRAYGDAPRLLGMSARYPAVYAGFNLDAPGQFVVGGLIDLRRPGSDGLLSFVPELALGFGSGGTSLLLAGNVAVRIPTFRLGGESTITPRARLGLGLLAFSGSVAGRKSTQGVLNFDYGFSTNAFRVKGLGRPDVFFEHQGIDLFDLNRLVVGFQWRH
ncbi:MAG: outer membrane beta-barrel protein [Gemmatimonadota bacterium]